MDEKWKRLIAIGQEVADLEKASAVLDWDQQTYMPQGGSEARAQQMATLERLAHERLISPVVGELISDLEAAGYAGDDPFRKAVLREARRTHDQAVKIPTELVEEFVRVSSLAMGAWPGPGRKGTSSPFGRISSVLWN